MNASDTFHVISTKPIVVLAQANMTERTEDISRDPLPMAMEALEAGNGSLALEMMYQAIQEYPNNMEYQYQLGQLFVHLNRWDEAENIFQALLRTDPDRFQKCFFDLSSIRLKENDTNGALEYLEKAKAVDPGRAHYESGLVFMRTKAFDRAISSFDQAIIYAPHLSFECNLQKASAYAQNHHPSKAKEILNDLLKQELSEAHRQQVTNFLEEMESEIQTEKSWYLAVDLGAQYDSNVFQEPLDQVLSTPSSQGARDKSDFAYLATVYGKYDFWKNRSWKSGISYLHYQMVYQNLTENNLLGARPSIFLEYSSPVLYAGIDYSYTRYWVDNDPRVEIHAIQPRCLVIHNDRLRSEFYGGIEKRLYLDESPNDLHGYLGIKEYVYFRKGTTHIRVGYMLDHDDFSPDERGDISGHFFSAALNLPIYKDICFLDIEGIYQIRNFQFDPNIDRNETRDDDAINVNVQINGRLYKDLYFRAGYFQTWNDSNVTNDIGIDPYHFRRGVSLVMFTYVF